MIRTLAHTCICRTNVAGTRRWRFDIGTVRERVPQGFVHTGGHRDSEALCGAFFRERSPHGDTGDIAAAVERHRGGRVKITFGEDDHVVMWIAALHDGRSNAAGL